MTALAARKTDIADRVRSICAGLPPLPSSVRYYDDFQGAFQSIRGFAVESQWEMEADGITHYIDLLPCGEHLVAPLKHAAVWLLAKRSPRTVVVYCDGVRRFYDERRDMAVVEKMITLTPTEFKAEWVNSIEPFVNVAEAKMLKSLLCIFCDIGIGPWTKHLYNFARSLPTPTSDTYRTVRTGDCFMPVDQQSMIIDYLDEMAALVTVSPEQIEDVDLRDACMLVISFQYAFRSGQIARIRMADVRVFETGAVHFSAVLAKKRTAKERTRVTRRIKREWCPLFIEFLARRRAGMPIGKNAPEDSFLGLVPMDVGIRMRLVTERLTGESWTSTDLRHTAAQRQVDAGVSHTTLAEFLGHSNIKTGNVYFDTSPTQAQRVNHALALSPIFSTVAEVARTQTIDKATLLAAPEDKQIGAVPHGVPIAGIGVCGVGQSLCTKNPVLSCYTCRKFMPLHDATIHQGVLDGLRPVVLQFEASAKGNAVSPAYTQLRRTLTAVEQVVADIEMGVAVGHE